MRHRTFPVFAAALFAAAPCPAQHPSVGKDAPPIQATAWLNWKGDAPTLESLKGRVVLLEFWGTWCGPCVRAMPGIQKLHDRYAERGLTVLAISYETSDVMQPFLTRNAFTMPVGSDPKKSTIGAYPIDGWPTTVVIGKDGKIAHVGSPYDAEAAVEKALGLEAGEGAVLTAYLDSQKQTDKQKKREAIDRLVEKATTKFDVAAWAKGHLPAETVAAGGAPAPAPAAGGAPAKPVAKPADPIDALRKCGGVWADAAQRTAVLRQLAEVQEPIDLAAFAQQTMAKAFPFDMAELTALLKDKKYAAVLDAIGARGPAAAVLNAAAKSADLAAFCKTKSPEVRTNAKKAIMAQNWLFANALPRDEKVNKEFQGELAVSGMSLSPDRKSIVGILLGGEQLHRDHATAFVRSQLARMFLMEDLAAGKPPRIKELPKLIDDAKKEIVRDLESRYGKPEPFVPKADGAAMPPSTAPAKDSDLMKNDPAIKALDAFIAGAKIDKTAEHWKRMLPQPPTLPFTATNDYFWHIDTECGPITLRYFPEAAPQHVSSGLYLARLGFYDGLTFHRAIPGFMAQGGDPLGNGQGDPGYRIPGEFKNGLLHSKAGVLSMARSRDADSAGSQFMITFGPTPTLDNQFTVWGEVASGMDTVKELEKKGTRENNGTLATPLKIHRSWISVAPKGSTPKAEKAND